jgi:hypothetical protein
MFSKGNAAHPVGCDSPLQRVIVVWCNFICGSPLLTIMAVTPDWITQKNGRRALKAVLMFLKHVKKADPFIFITNK